MRVKIIITLLLLLSLSSVSPAGEKTQGIKRFQPVGESIVVDTLTGLMWAAMANGRDINWYDAEIFCEEFEAGGHTDWRLPSLKELATLFTEDIPNEQGYYITPVISISQSCMWSADYNMGGASMFSFKSGKKTRPEGVQGFSETGCLSPSSASTTG